MPKPVVALDLDSTVAPFCEYFTGVAVKLGITPKVLYEADRDTWELPFPMNPVWRHIDDHPEFWSEMGSLLSPTDVEAMAWLSERAHIIYVTGRGGKHISQVGLATRKWIRKVGLPDGPIFFVPGGSDKDEILLPMKYQLAGVIDDKPVILEKMAAHGIPVVARDWQYNRHVDVPRVSRIEDFVGLVAHNLETHDWR